MGALDTYLKENSGTSPDNAMSKGGNSIAGVVTPTYTPKQRANPTSALDAYQQYDQETSREGRFNATIAEGQKQAEDTMNPGVLKTIGDVVKGIPKAAGQILTNPEAATVGIVGGALDFGPRVVNTLAGLFTDKQVLPYAGKTIGDLYGEKRGFTQEQKDVTQATNEGTIQTAGYGTGQGIMGKAASSLNLGKTGTTIVKGIGGDALGGQLTIGEDATLKDRGAQLLFDTIFGGVTEFGPGAVKNVIKKVPKSVDGITPPVAKTAPAISDDLIQKMEAEGIQNPVELPNRNPLNASSSAYKEGGVTIRKAKPGEKLGMSEDGTPGQAYTNTVKNSDGSISYEIVIADRFWKNKEAKQALIDLEYGHVVSKRLGEGMDGASMFTGADPAVVQVLDRTIGKIARDFGESLDDFRTSLAQEMKLLAPDETVPSEMFSVAFKRAVTEGGEEFAQAYPRISTIVKTTPEYGNIKLIQPSTVKDLEVMGFKVEDVPTKLPENTLQVDGKVYKLEGDALKKYQKAKETFDSRSSLYKGKTDQQSQKSLKGIGMEFSAAKRQISGQLTPTELDNALKQERSNYTGKKVTAIVNGDELKATIDGKPSFGKFPVKLEDGTIVKLGNEDILDKRTQKELVDKILKREGVSLYKKEGAAPTQKTVEVKQQTEQIAKPKVATSSDMGSLVSKTDMSTGKKGNLENTKTFGKDISGPDQLVAEYKKLLDANKAEIEKGLTIKSWDDAEQMARKLSEKINTEEFVNLIKNNPPGSAMNNEVVALAKQIQSQKMYALVNLKNQLTENASVTQLKQVEDLMADIVAINKATTGAVSEAARVLNYAKRAVSPVDYASLKQLSKELNDIGISTTDLEGSLKKLEKEFTMTRGQKVAQAYLQTWYASILSGPGTTVRNMLGNSTTLLTDIASRLANPKLWGEIPTTLENLVTGLSKGYKSANAYNLHDKSTYLKNRANYFYAKGDTVKYNKLLQESKDAANKAKDSLDEIGVSEEAFLVNYAQRFEALEKRRGAIFTGKYAPYGRAVESVGRFLNAQDEIVGMAAKESEQAALKVYNPQISEAINEALGSYSKVRATFQGNPTSKTVGAMMNAAETLRMKQPKFNIIIPFVKTVANVIDRQFDYVPGTSFLRITDKVLNKQVDDVVKIAQRKNPYFSLTDNERMLMKNRLRDQQIGRAVFGLGMTGAAIGMAMNGKISGAGPSNYSERVLLQRTGWRPYSVKIGDTWVPYQYWGPVAAIFAAAGSVADKVKYDDADNKTVTDLVGKGVISWVQSQLDQSFMTGIADLFDVVSGRTPAGDYLTKTGANLIPIPAAYTQTRGMFDRTVYDTRNIVQAVGSRLGFNANIPERLDMFGEPMQRDIIYGVTGSIAAREKADAVDGYLSSNNIVITLPQKNRSYNIPGTSEKKTLTPKEYKEYVEKSGKEIYSIVSSQLEMLEQMDNDSAEKYIKAVVDNTREKYRMELLVNN
jgi:hypothetical protein